MVRHAPVGEGVRRDRRRPGGADRGDAVDRARSRPAHAPWPAPAGAGRRRRRAAMTMSPWTRKLGLVAHVGASVGWLGSIAASLALAVLGLAAADPATVRAVYLVLEPVGWSTLVPLSLASLVTGLIQALGSSWGLVRHYWVLTKLAMNLLDRKSTRLNSSHVKISY